MTARPRGARGSARLKVVPEPRGDWVVLNRREVILSEHRSATEAELAAVARMAAGDELVVYDRYHRCHSVRR